MNTFIGVLLYFLVMFPDGSVRLYASETKFSSVPECEEAANVIVPRAYDELKKDGIVMIRYRCRESGTIE